MKNFNSWKIGVVVFQLLSIAMMFIILFFAGVQYGYSKKYTERDVSSLTLFQQRFPQVQNLKDPQKEKMIIDEWIKYALKGDQDILEAYKSIYKILFYAICSGIGLNCFLIYMICNGTRHANQSTRGANEN